MATWTDIDNGEGGGSVRSKLNTAMQYLFGWIADPPEEEDQSKWEEHGDTAIKPKNEKGAIASWLNIADEFIVPPSGSVAISRDMSLIGNLVISDKVKLTALATGGDPKQAMIDSAGHVITADEMPGSHTFTLNVYSENTGLGISGYITLQGVPGYENQLMPFSETLTIEDLPDIFSQITYVINDINVQYQTYVGTISSLEEDTTVTVFMSPLNHGGSSTRMVKELAPIKSLSPANSIIIAKPAAAQNVEYTLPSAAANEGKEFTVRKAYAGYATTIFSVTEEKINMDDESGDVITAEEKGAWVVLKSDGAEWNVLMDSGNWTIDD